MMITMNMMTVLLLLRWQGQVLVQITQTVWLSSTIVKIIV